MRWGGRTTRGGEEFWTRREGGGGEIFWTSRQGGRFFYSFHVLWVFWALLIFWSNMGGEKFWTRREGGAKNFGRVI